MGHKLLCMRLWTLGSILTARDKMADNIEARAAIHSLDCTVVMSNKSLCAYILIMPDMFSVMAPHTGISILISHIQMGAPDRE